MLPRLMLARPAGWLRPPGVTSAAMVAADDTTSLHIDEPLSQHLGVLGTMCPDGFVGLWDPLAPAVL